MTAVFLKDIVVEKKAELSIQKAKTSLDVLREMIAEDPIGEKISFKNALRRRAKEPIHFIAEIKKASPSKGIIRENADILDISKNYTSCGASAISVLTDEKYFHGSLEDLNKVSHKTELPVLRKDFIIDMYQIYEAKANGASAVLLIVAILDKDQLMEFQQLARSLGLDVLVEVHTKNELNIAIEAGVEIVGINNRDLRTFKVDLNTSKDLIEHVPDETLAVVESGIHTRQDVLYFENLRVDALLVGEALMGAPDIREQLCILMGKEYDMD